MFARTLASLSLIGLVAVFAQPALATEDTPLSIPGGGFASVEQAKALFDKGVMFVDARVAVEYVEKHVKGAVNVPFKEEFSKVSKTGPGDKFDMAKLPSDKNKEMVFYCNGTPCWKGYKAAALAIKAGYKKVHWYRDGLPAWDSKGFPVE